MEIKKTRIFEQKDLISLFHSVGWDEHSANYPSRLENAMYHSSNVFSAWEGNELLGLLSVMDDSFRCFITYLLVRPEYQNKGIGTCLMKECMKHYENYRFEVTTGGAETFYKKFGFEIDGVCMNKYLLPTMP